MNRIYNFSAGPATMPPSVLEEVADAVREYDGSGMSILELSHRGKHYDPIHAEALSEVLVTLGLSSDEYRVVLVGGGASLQFAMLPMNFLSPGQSADYLVGGEWGVKAAEDARRFGSVCVCGPTTDRLPPPIFSESARYAHLTTNNTIEGTQYHGELPDTRGVPLTADASSDIFGVDRDYSKFDLLYAGAQKNAGPAGVTMVVIRRSFLETANKNLPPMLSYAVQVAKDSLYNTPPVFPIFVLTRVLRWIRAEGGVSAIAARNERKANVRLCRSRCRAGLLQAVRHGEIGAFLDEHHLAPRRRSPGESPARRNSGKQHGWAQRPPQRRRLSRQSL